MDRHIRVDLSDDEQYVKKQNPIYWIVFDWVLQPNLIERNSMDYVRLCSVNKFA